MSVHLSSWWFMGTRTKLSEMTGFLEVSYRRKLA